MNKPKDHLSPLSSCCRLERVKLLEYEAKQLLADAGVLVPVSSLVQTSEALSLPLPVVLKSQVPIGGRGKLGGVQIIEQVAELADAVEALLVLDIKGYLPTVLLAEEKLLIQHEHYLALRIDRIEGVVQLMAHPKGGVEIETHTSGFFTRTFEPDQVEAIASQLALSWGYEETLPATLLQYLLTDLYDCFVANDATLLEINPLIYTTEGTFIAGDCKMELDDNAAFRHDWQFEAKSTETNFVTLDLAGTIATIANGAGLAMATVDAVADSGLVPANFLDIGGGSDIKSLLLAFERLMGFTHLQGIIINIVAGISRCDEIARAIIAAQAHIPTLPPLYIRLAGTNYEEAMELLTDAGIATLPTLEDCIIEAQEAHHL